MVSRDLGDRGYYPRKKHAVQGKGDSKTNALNFFLLLVLAILFLMLLRESPLQDFLGNPQKTPLPLGDVSSTPSPSFPDGVSPSLSNTVFPTATASATVSVPTVTPSEQSARFLINLTLGPTDYKVGETVLRVFKNLFVTENAYRETLDISNVGGASVDFDVIDVIPGSFAITVRDANFAKPFEELDENSARTAYNLGEGENTIHGPNRLPVGNTTNAVLNLFLSGTGSENGEAEGVYAYLDLGFEQVEELPVELQGVFASFVSERLSAGSFEADDDEEAIQADLEDYAETLLINHKISKALGPELNYSNLTEITLTISESDTKRWFSIPLNERRYGEPLFKLEGDLRDVAQFDFVYNETLLNLSLDFSDVRRMCGKIPFDQVRGVLNYSFAAFLPELFNTVIIVRVVHNDVGSVFAGGSSCEDAAKVINEAKKHVGTPYKTVPNMPKTFSCAAFVWYSYKTSGAYSFPKTLLAKGLLNMAKKVGKEVSFEELQPADLMFCFNTYCASYCCPNCKNHVTHAALYLGDGMAIHSGDPVKIVPASRVCRGKGGGRFATAVRVLNCDSNATGDEDAEESVNASVVDEAAQKTKIVSDIEKECADGGELGAEFLEYWKSEIEGQDKPLPSACYDSAMNALLDSYMKSNGLYDKGFDKELVLAIMATESSCNHNTGNKQGIMQVVACGNKGGCSLEENIDLGTKHLAGDFDALKSKGITGGGAIPTLITFSYNRGKGTQAKAVSLYLGGMDLKEAMKQACYYYYDKGSYGGCGGFGKTQCCTGSGLGVGYPKRVAKFYSYAVKNKQS